MRNSSDSTESNAAQLLRDAADCFVSEAVGCLPDAERGREFATAALAHLPPALADRVRTILAADVDDYSRACALDEIVAQLRAAAARTVAQKAARAARAARDAAQKAMLAHVARAREAGASSVTTPDGYTLHFSKPADENPGNALDKWVARHAN